MLNRRELLGTFSVVSTLAASDAPPPKAVRFGGPIFLKTDDPGELAREHRHLGYSAAYRSEEHTSELQSLRHLVCRLLLEKELQRTIRTTIGFLRLAPPRGLATLCTDHCITCEALPIFFLRTRRPPNLPPFHHRPSFQ